MKKYFLRKSAFEKVFQSLMRGTAKRHGFLHIGAHLVAKGVLGHMRQIDPHFHVHRGKIGQFKGRAWPLLGLYEPESPRAGEGRGLLRS